MSRMHVPEDHADNLSGNEDAGPRGGTCDLCGGDYARSLAHHLRFECSEGSVDA